MVTSDVLLDASVDSQTLDAAVELVSEPAKTVPSRFASGGEAGTGEPMTPPASDAGTALDAQTADSVEMEVLDAGESAVSPVDAGSDAKATLEAAAPTDTKACDPSGVWALRLQADVSSPATPFSNSSGQARVWLLLNVRAASGAYEAQTQLCGVDFPAISLLPDYGGEKYQIQFPRSSADKPDGLPSGSIRLRADANTISLDPLAIALGSKLDLGVQAAWPEDGASVAFDADADGSPGITTTWSTANGQQLPPLDLGASARAQRTQLTGRVTLGATSFSGCDFFNGAGGAARLDTHVIGCTRTDGSACSSDQTSILESLKPDYAASQSTLQAKKLASASRCVDVLKAYP